MENGHTAKWIGVVVVAAGLALAGAKAANAEGERTWRVSDIKGSASVSLDGTTWTALKRGDRVEPGTAVKTGGDGRVIMVRTGDSLDVAPDSHFNIPAKAQAGAKNPATHIMQKMGTILFKITTRPDNPFTVKTPYLAAVIKGTTFTVSVNGNDAALHVSKGAVQVSSILGGQTALVRPGQTAAVGASNGGRMRLIGIKGQAAPAGKGDKSGGNTDAASATKGENSMAGRGTIARSVIPQAIGEKHLNIEKVSRGLVNDASANAGARGKAVGGKKGGNGLKSLSGSGNPIGALTIPLSAPTTYGANGNTNFNGNRRSNGNGGGNNGGGNNGGGNNGGGNNGGGNNGGGNNGGGNN
jgi:hypothetical protein